MAKCKCGAPEETKCKDCGETLCDACVEGEGRCEECAKKQKSKFSEMSEALLSRKDLADKHAKKYERTKEAVKEWGKNLAKRREERIKAAKVNEAAELDWGMTADGKWNEDEFFKLFELIETAKRLEQELKSEKRGSKTRWITTTDDVIGEIESLAAGFSKLAKHYIKKESR